MKFKNKVNEVRRSILHRLTQKIGNARETNVNRSFSPERTRRILIIRPNNRLGNQLLITPLVQDVARLFPNARVDLFVRGGLSFVIFKHYDNIGRIILLPKKPFKALLSYIGVWLSLRKYRYDMVINVVDGSSSGRLSTAWARADTKLYGYELPELKNQYPDYVHIAKMAVYNLRYYLACSGLKESGVPLPVPDIRLTVSELAHGKALLNNLVSAEKKTITLYTYATGAKCFSESWWLTFYEKLTNRYAERYNIIEMLPIENVSQISFKTPSFYSRDIREMAALMANTEVYIGADCGIMHLASAAKIPVVGLFSTTNADVYQPYNDGSVAVDTQIMISADDLLPIIDRVLAGVYP
jgi:ADP-heptose:LPS heptosyltransferase